MAYNEPWRLCDPITSIARAFRRGQFNFVSQQAEPAGYLWRFEDVSYAASDEYGDTYSTGPQVEIICYPVKHFTPTGARLFYNPKRWRSSFVSLTSQKRFACKSVGEALRSYIARKQRQESIYLNRAATARKCIQQAEGLQFK